MVWGGGGFSGVWLECSKTQQQANLVILSKFALQSEQSIGLSHLDGCITPINVLARSLRLFGGAFNHCYIFYPGDQY